MLGGVNTVLSQILVHGLPTPSLCLKTLVPEAWVVPHQAPIHTTLREEPQVVLSKDQSGKWLAILVMPSRKLTAAILGHWAIWADQGQPQGESSIAILFYISSECLEWQEFKRLCWFLLCHPFNDINDYVEWTTFGGGGGGGVGWLSPLKKKIILWP